MSAYDKLARPIQKWIRANGWGELRPIQADAIHAIMDSTDDIIVSAATAGGKTEAAFLPLISQVLEHPKKTDGFDLVYIGPLKALITDQAMRLKDICHETNLPVYPWHGDISGGVKKRAMKTPKGILLITPESLEAMLMNHGLEISRLFGSTSAIVIDELHNFLDSERGVQMRSLLARMEIATRHPIRRVGLSATLGDMNIAGTYLRPDKTVKLISNDDEKSELRLQLCGYISNENSQDGDSGFSAIDRVSEHLFNHLRTSNNLIFAGARNSVETYTAKLRDLCGKHHVPQAFEAHHANLSKEHRNYVERSLKQGGRPMTAICTSTLELGIDIGDVNCVAQVGAPFSVASLRQRLGRSGRRKGQAQKLRQYAVEARLDSKSNIVDQFRLGLIRSIAMIELLGEKWCEPPGKDALHLSTLVHQILSVIREKGGAREERLYRTLCEKGPFKQVDRKLFQDVLRSIGRADARLIEQASDGTLLPAQKGEQVTEHYSFYAVFKTPEEFRFIGDGQGRGTLPVDNVLAPGMNLIFSGKRWTIRDIDYRDKVIIAKTATAGNAPVFGGEPGIVHDRVIEKMFGILKGNFKPNYMDETALELLREARTGFMRSEFINGSIAVNVDGSCILATYCGTIKSTTLALALSSFGFEPTQHDGFLSVNPGEAEHDLVDVLENMADGKIPDLFAHGPNLIFEKHHSWLTPELLQRDALSSRIDAKCLPELCLNILSGFKQDMDKRIIESEDKLEV